MQRRVLLAGEPVRSLTEYEAQGGGQGLAVAERLGPAGVLDEIELSGLRGRGGAGFPTGVKWRSIATGGDEVGERFVVANGAEGEPGTFKDRTILRHNPYLAVEGLLIAARTVGARRAFFALKRSFEQEAQLVERALAEVAEAGWAPDVTVALVRGPDEYLFGEEKGLLEVIEGEEPLPRMFPPYVYGLFTTSPQMGWSAGVGPSHAGPEVISNPTLVNNVESLSTVPLVVARGGEWYRSMGTPESPGTMVCTVSGDTVRHGVGEYELGTPLEAVVAELGGGMPDGRRLKYVLSGVANPVLHGHQVDTPLCYEGMDAVGSGLGTGGFMVFDDRTHPGELAAAVSRFLWVESCGQCPACKLGSQAITEQLEHGLVAGFDEQSFMMLSARLSKVTDASRCYLPTQEQLVVHSLLADLRNPAAHEGTEYRGLLITKIIDLVGDRFLLDEKQARKRADWTYAPA